MNKCKDCIHMDVCELNPFITAFSPDNDAYCGAFKNREEYAPVKHGRWIVDIDHLRATCSECGKILRFSDEMQIAFLRDEERFCYFCGSKMVLEVADGNMDTGE